MTVCDNVTERSNDDDDEKEEEAVVVAVWEPSELAPVVTGIGAGGGGGGLIRLRRTLTGSSRDGITSTLT